MRLYRAKEKLEQERRNAKRRERYAERKKQEQEDAEDILREQESNYNRMIGESLRR